MKEQVVLRTKFKGSLEENFVEARIMVSAVVVFFHPAGFDSPSPFHC